jgi:hypothetical protein
MNNNYKYWPMLMIGAAMIQQTNATMRIQQQQRSLQQRSTYQNQQQKYELQQQLDRSIQDKRAADLALTQQKAVQLSLETTLAQQKAIQASSTVVSRKNIDIILDAVIAADRKGDYQQVIQTTTDLLNHNPNLETASRFFAHGYRARAFAASGKKELAIKEFQTAAVIGRSLGIKDVDTKIANIINNLHRCGKMNCVAIKSTLIITPPPVVAVRPPLVRRNSNRYFRNV